MTSTLRYLQPTGRKLNILRVQFQNRAFPTRGRNSRGLLGVTRRWPGALQKLGVVVSSMGLVLLSPLWEMHLYEQWVRAILFRKTGDMHRTVYQTPYLPFYIYFQEAHCLSKNAMCIILLPAVFLSLVGSGFLLWIWCLLLCQTVELPQKAEGRASEMFSLTSCETGSGFSKGREKVTADLIISANMWWELKALDRWCVCICVCVCFWGWWWFALLPW